MNYWECANCGRHSIDVDAHNGRPVCTSCKSYNVANLNLAPPGRLAPAARRGFDAVDSSASNGVEMFSPLEIQLKAKLAAAEAEVLRVTTRVQELEAEDARRRREE